jgi:hypothetical protein
MERNHISYRTSTPCFRFDTCFNILLLAFLLECCWFCIRFWPPLGLPGGCRRSDQSSCPFLLLDRTFMRTVCCNSTCSMHWGQVNVWQRRTAGNTLRVSPFGLGFGPNVRHVTSCSWGVMPYGRGGFSVAAQFDVAVLTLCSRSVACVVPLWPVGGTAQGCCCCCCLLQ